MSPRNHVKHITAIILHVGTHELSRLGILQQKIVILSFTNMLNTNPICPKTYQSHAHMHVRTSASKIDALHDIEEVIDRMARLFKDLPRLIPRGVSFQIEQPKLMPIIV